MKAWEFADIVNQTYLPDLRKGQKFSNLLIIFDASLAKKVPQECDPFYDDNKLPAFIKWLEENWNDQAEHENNVKLSKWAYLLNTGVHK